jgi:UPF0755 protein
MLAGLVLALEFILGAVLSQRASGIWLPESPRAVDLVVKSGETYKQLVGELVAAGVAKPPVASLYGYGRLTGAGHEMKKGRYKIAAYWSPVQAVEQTQIGPNNSIRVKIQPGFTLSDCALALASAGCVESASGWIGCASSASRLKGLNLPSYEGLLAPNTYFFDGETEPDRILAGMHQRWKSLITQLAGTADLKQRLRNGLTLYDTVILASIIEREAANPVDMATAASVFHNRVKKNWPLGSAATLRYALKSWKGSDDELPIGLKSPFNTSRRPGLPPTPICIPGAEALAAAISPPETPYLFFVADGDGGLVFTKTLDAHRTGVKGYKKKRAEKARLSALAPVSPPSEEAASQSPEH